MGRRAVLAERLVTYLESDWVAATPQERGSRAGKLGEALSSVLEELMRGQPDWDARYRWLDGVSATATTRTGPDGLRIVGGAFAMDGRKCLLRPIEATLVLPPGIPHVRFAGADREVSYGEHWQRRLTPPESPEDWPHIFAIELCDDAG
jgi:hypothetical protein